MGGGGGGGDVEVLPEGRHRRSRGSAGSVDDDCWAWSRSSGGCGGGGVAVVLGRVVLAHWQTHLHVAGGLADMCLSLGLRRGESTRMLGRQRRGGNVCFRHIEHEGAGAVCLGDGRASEGQIAVDGAGTGRRRTLGEDVADLEMVVWTASGWGADGCSSWKALWVEYWVIAWTCLATSGNRNWICSSSCFDCG
jgi:hypothetical protein